MAIVRSVCWALVFLIPATPMVAAAKSPTRLRGNNASVIAIEFTGSTARLEKNSRLTMIPPGYQFTDQGTLVYAEAGAGAVLQFGPVAFRGGGKVISPLESSGIMVKNSDLSDRWRVERTLSGRGFYGAVAATVARIETIAIRLQYEVQMTTWKLEQEFTNTAPSGTKEGLQATSKDLLHSPMINIDWSFADNWSADLGLGYRMGHINQLSYSGSPVIRGTQYSAASTVLDGTGQPLGAKLRSPIVSFSLRAWYF